MLIEQIKLFNFRAYEGHQELYLSCNPEKHVTVISGQNGFGKTSLLTSLVWVLYGKLMADVDERYRREIYESGGYQKYASKIMNKNALLKAPSKFEELSKLNDANGNVLEAKKIKENINNLFTFSVSITIKGLFIPHLSCNSVTICRRYNTRNDNETLDVLIDGKPNELTKTIGQEIFINDFILPKEIAKFFFFDAEKITALAEVKSNEEKTYFSKAYNEVLGIKKYVDLKVNLENLQIRISKKSANKGDLKKIEELQDKLKELNSLLELNQEEFEIADNDWIAKRGELSEMQERLIRAGSSLSVNELQEFKTMKLTLQDALAKNKSAFLDMLELAPFAMMLKKLLIVKQQINLEERQLNINLVNGLLQEKYEILNKAFRQLDIANQNVIDEVLKNSLFSQQNIEAKILLEYSPSQINQFNAVFDNLVNAYSKNFKLLIADSKRIQSSLNIANKKVQDAELKADDPVIKKMKDRFEKLSSDVEDLEKSKLKSKINIAILEKEISTINRQLSEHTKHIKIERQDQEKTTEARNLITQLEKFITLLKLRKKDSLEKNIKRELNILMHKGDFVGSVNVKIDGDLIDIDLYDINQQLINKESLSKGEQQLYATALLKALIMESNIQFPVFIDSPLQKLDKTHSINIIKDFYPSVSAQVILFPLLEKELSSKEYELLLPKIGKSYLIAQNKSFSSTFMDLWPTDLFSQFNKGSDIYV